MPVDRAHPKSAHPESAHPENARPELTEQGGDPVCWMHLLCPACGAMPDGAEPDRATCPRCGEELER